MAYAIIEKREVVQMEFVYGNVYNVKELNSGKVHVFKVIWVGGSGSIEVRIIASTSYAEGSTLEIGSDSRRWYENANWMLKEGTNPTHEVKVSLTDHHKQFFIDLALATRDWDWLKKLQTMEVVQ